MFQVRTSSGRFGLSRWSAIFFIVYLVLNLYIFMSVFLAVVYNQFKENLKKEVRENVERRTMLLDKVYELIKSEGLNGITKENFFRLMEATHHRSAAAFRDYIGVLWFVLDPNETGSISRDALKSLVELLSLPCCDIYRYGSEKSPLDKIYCKLEMLNLRN